MTVLPMGSPSSSGWTLDDRDDAAASSQAATGGTCSVTFGPVPEDERWLVERITVSCSSSTPTTCTLYTDVVDVTRAVDFTPSGNFDVADETAPILLRPGTLLIVVWANASNNAVGTARIQNQVQRRG